MTLNPCPRCGSMASPFCKIGAVRFQWYVGVKCSHELCNTKLEFFICREIDCAQQGVLDIFRNEEIHAMWNQLCARIISLNLKVTDEN